MAKSESSDTERRVLMIMKDILTRVAKETATPRGTRHVLSNDTIERIRDCLALISSREMELTGDGREISSDRPKYPGPKNPGGSVKVNVNELGRRPTKKSH
jgi:hypothetical protein